MIHAYLEIYLSKAQAVLGDAFDYAVNACDISGEDFVKLFVASSISKRMENGEPACLSGKSGIEIVVEIVAETNLKRIRTAYGFTQAEFSKRSGVSLQAIQMYEQRNKNINKANFWASRTGRTSALGPRSNSQII